MILTDYYKSKKLGQSEYRYDIVSSTQSYESLENLLINKRKFNIGGLSFNYVPRPGNWSGAKERVPEMAITKNSSNISSIFIPDLNTHFIGYGDIVGTQDAIILQFSADYSTIELFIARGYKNDILALYTAFKEGDLTDEANGLRAKATNVFKGELLNQ